MRKGLESVSRSLNNNSPFTPKTSERFHKYIEEIRDSTNVIQTK